MGCRKKVDNEISLAGSSEKLAGGPVSLGLPDRNFSLGGRVETQANHSASSPTKPYRTLT